MSSSSYDDAKYLTNYLKEHGITPQSDMFYVLISRNSCIYCSQYSHDIIEELLDCPNMVVITGEKDISIPEHHSHGAKVVFDRSFDFDYLPYNLAGTNIVRIVDGKILVQEFDTNNIRKFKSQLFHNCRGSEL
jgi:hypothetical protein